ncbi:MAG: cyclic nucleotide-binding domain-containing protein [Calditrichaeota bacterium]|nr:MAG: cyclic nucleotide-binding domain-containing protein [Calditrichota bacterium]
MSAPQTASQSSTQTVPAGQWLIVEGSTPAYFLYKLISGQVGIYKEGQKIATVTVHPGAPPRFLGILSTLSADREHRASVKAETDVEVETIYIDHIRGILAHEVPREIRQTIQAMIEAIVIADEIKSLRRKLSHMPVVELEIPETLDPELKHILTELRKLYECLIYDQECREQF